jgi:hypothetical protein
MNLQDIKRVINEWINRPERDVPDLRSRLIIKAGRQAQRDWDIVGRPDFGRTMASQLFNTGLELPSIGAPAYRWLLRGVEHLESLGKTPSGNSDLLAVCEADTLQKSADNRLLIQAALLGWDASTESVAAALNLAPPVVNAYSDLWFNVVDRRDEPAYRAKAVEAALTRPGMLYDARNVHPNDEALIRTGLKGTLADVMLLAGRQGRVLEAVN